MNFSTYQVPARTLLALSCAALFTAAPVAHAADDVTAAQLRQQIEALRLQYEERLRALEAQVQQMAAKGQGSTPAVAGAASPAEATRGVGGREANAASAKRGFNPDIAMIVSGTYANLRKDPGTWRINGFPTGDEEVGPGEKGLSLSESEITLSANIDPWWFGSLTMALTPENEVEVEEAFVQTTALSNGLTVKAGRFFSGLGYLNEQHAHTWDFVDAPLAYQAMLGGQYGQNGVQAKWVLPTDQFVELGAELGRGDGFPGTGSAHNGAGASALFAHVGGDVGLSHSWRAGVSHLWTRAAERTWVDDNDLSNGFTGKSRLWVLDGVWKWAPQGNAKVNSFKLQGEYFRRQERGEVVHDAGGAAELADAARVAQSGWYLQGLYQFAPAWKVGVRHDRLDIGTLDYGLNNANIARPDQDPKRTSVMLDWAMSEFSRWRLQVNSDQARGNVRDTQVFLQYQMSLGAHGAHGF